MWRTLTLEQACELVTDGSHNSPKDYFGGLPMASVKDMTREGINIETCRTISKEDFQLLVKNGCQPKYDDVLIAKDGATCLDTVCIYRQKDEIVLLSSIAILRPGSELDSGFLRYYLEAPDTKAMMKSGYVSGSAIPRVVLKDFRRAPINMPSLPEQRAISGILGTLDDKIELNRRMNRTLESMARAVFRQWFVESEEVGDWDVAKIRDVCEKVENGGTPRRDQPEYWEPGTIPWLTSGEVRQEIIISTDNKISEEGYKKSSAKMWREGTTVVALYGATAGEVSFIAHELCANQACCGLIPNDGWQYFIYLTLSVPENSLASQARGSAQQNLSQQIVADFSIRKPNQKRLDDFNKIVAPVFDKWIANLKESRTLASLRDSLLPKLMRREVRVSSTDFVTE